MKSRCRSLTLLEDIFIILAIFSLWPTILGWQGVVFRIIQFVALSVLAAILIRRIGRIKGYREKPN